MINVLIGTKGQLVKMAPVLKEMDARGIRYNYINANQHTRILDEISGQFLLKKPDFLLEGLGRDVKNSGDMLTWAGKNLWKYGLRRKRIFMRENRRSDVLLVHGDASPALLGLILGKMDNIKIAHIEAGERTHNKFAPFPEEVIRVVVDKHSDCLFASSDRAFRNLQEEGLGEKTENIKVNTLFDAVKIAVNSKESPCTSGRYVLASIHRFETISSKKRLSSVVESINKAAAQFDVVFPMHESTKDRLKRFGLIDRLDSKVRKMQLLDYFSFIKHLDRCEYIITDGGGPQEESHFLGKPCLLMRSATERDHLNVYVSGFDAARADQFIENYKNFETNNLVRENSDRPSAHILDCLEEYL